MPHRSATEFIPDHLRPFIARQDPSFYTAIDHASWRFILRISKSYFSQHAHQKYLDGLKETGISLERIPLIEEMDQCLKRFGWRAVAVSGFIPPAVFMEFQSLGILPIACEMRTLEHLAYTPAPDIVHEAAGHAPIIADPEYAEYLRNYGEVARKAIFSSRDMAVYDAIRDLSDIKENPKSTTAEITQCQKRLDEAIAATSYTSEATYLARMNWWTVEYGLVGSLDEPKIYGAGLLSSVGESYHCLSPEVRKIPFTLDCINNSYDITRPQPQLYVTPDFKKLTEILEEMAKSMAFKQGGVPGLSKAKMAETVTTTMLDSALQISGVLADFFLNAAGQPIFLKYTGPCQLSYQDQELEGHAPGTHREGFSTPIGRIQGLGKSPADLTDRDLEAQGFTGRKKGTLRFESGIELTGVLKSKLVRDGRTLVLSFTDCTIRYGQRILFQPEWGTFDLACGVKVPSVFGGAADRRKYIEAIGGYKERPRAPKSNLTEKNRPLNALYAQVRELREKSPADLETQLERIQDALETQFPEDWLLSLELLELAPKESALATRIRKVLETHIQKTPEHAQLIRRGLELIP